MRLCGLCGLCGLCTLSDDQHTGLLTYQQRTIKLLEIHQLPLRR